MTNTTENTTIITAELKAEYYWDKFSNAMEVWLEKPTRENRKKMNAYEKLYNKYMEVLNPTEQPKGYLCNVARDGHNPVSEIQSAERKR